MIPFSAPVLAFFLFYTAIASAQKIHISEADEGWAENSINTIIFRKKPLMTNKGTQFISYFDAAGKVIVGKRKLTIAPSHDG